MPAAVRSRDARSMNLPNDETLRHARARLLARGAELRDRIRRVDSDLHREREPLPADFAEAAIAIENDEVLEAISSTARAELVHVEHALANLDAGAFGRCADCGNAIDATRLAIVPHAARCVSCEGR
jgi:DnaK suppressor protein